MNAQNISLTCVLEWQNISTINCPSHKNTDLSFSIAWAPFLSLFGSDFDIKPNCFWTFPMCNYLCKIGPSSLSVFSSHRVSRQRHTQNELLNDCYCYGGCLQKLNSKKQKRTRPLFALRSHDLSTRQLLCQQIVIYIVKRIKWFLEIFFMNLVFP